MSYKCRKKKKYVPQDKGKIINKPYLDTVMGNYAKHGYPKAKWMEFCEEMLDQGYKVYLKESKHCSKYVTVLNSYNGKKFLVRFSNHKPIPYLEAKGTCDFFVGVTNQTITNTYNAIFATKEALGEYIPPKEKCMKWMAVPNNDAPWD